MDVHRIRQDFPILYQEVRPGVPLVYLDSTATSQKPRQVIEAMSRYYETTNANVHRGIYTLSEQATEAYEGARKKIRAFINAASWREIVFTRNTTESINLVAQSWGRSRLGPDDAVVITEMEHHSNIVPWQLLREQTGVRLLVVPVLDDGTLDMEVYDRLLRTEQVRLVAVTHMSNVLGTINPLEEMVRKAHTAGALVLADAAQSVPHLPVDVQALDVDFLAFSGHKMLGPTGIGVLYARRSLLEEMPPYQGGGDMIRRVRLSGSEWNELPYKFEAGTPAIAEGIGLGVAVDYLTAVGMDAIHTYEQQITAYALERLAEVPGLRVYGPDAARKGGVAAFTLDRLHPHDVAQMLDVEGVAVRAGHHCAMPLHERFAIPATTRASFYLYNTLEEVDTLIEALYRVLQVFTV
ncbi:MAG: cysteine desulfurase [Anaerolineae bacterium]|nr:cysteine desulfurase [Anaerolineae bacterium]